MRRGRAVRSFRAVASPFSIPGAKSTLVLALTMTLFGVVGVGRSSGILTASPGEIAADPSAPPELAAATTTFAEAFLFSPVQKAAAVANLLVSALLLIASFQMTARARSALWWTSQALWANAAYSLVAAGANIYLFSVHRSALSALAEAMMRAQPGGEAVPPDGAAGIPVLAMALSAVVGAALAGLYLLMLRVARRESVQKFVRREA